jgi:hypothetical protein
MYRLAHYFYILNMVKKIAFIAVFLCFATVASAEMGMKIGARLGYSMQGVGSLDKGMQGFGAGIVLEIPVGSFFISPELAFLYRNNWSMETFNAAGEVIDWTQPEMALSVPLIFKFFVQSFYTSLGFQVDVPISPQECLDNKCIDMDGKDGLSYKRAAADVGLVWGLGYMVTSSFGIDFRSVVGFLPHFETKNVLGLKTESDSMSSYGLGISYFF